MLSTGEAAPEPAEGTEEGREIPANAVTEEGFRMGVILDPLNTVLIFFVPLTATMIFIYASGYMGTGHYWTLVLEGEDHHDADQHDEDHDVEAHHDDHGHHTVVDDAGRTIAHTDATKWKARFMGIISLFAGGMLLLTMADNLLLLFMGWEIMGLCSYLLIGFWNDRIYPNEPGRITPPFAGIKAFMTTRAADVVMLIGIAWLYSVTGTLSYREILYNEEVLHALEAMAFPANPLLAPLGLSIGGAIALLLFTGTVGKSAQFPLHTWLPDAMEGPTPVSAMIHAATMVSAGIYLLLRFFPLISLGWGHGVEGFPLQMQIIAGVGAFTALFAATIAIAQNDIKKVLAYSTISQLGFMVAAVGIGAYIAAAFHLMTHAVFKALLFMGSGSVIHAVEHGAEHAEHHGHHLPIDFDPQDMRNMGGLLTRLPITAWTFIIGGAALSGFPFITAGFWSKDEILLDAWHEAPIVFWVLAIAAFLTAFYTARQIAMTFLGEPRTVAAEEAGPTGFRMEFPLIVLAVGAVLLGYIGVHPEMPVFGPIFSPDPEGSPFKLFVGKTLLESPELLALEAPSVITSIIVALGGLAVGLLVYGLRPLQSPDSTDPLKRLLGPVHTLLANKYYMDELYDAVFVRPAQAIAVFIFLVLDRGIIDNLIHSIARFTEWVGFRNKDFDTEIINGFGDRFARSVAQTGQQLKYSQTGRIQQYLVVVATGVILLFGVFLYTIFLR
ncbi:MAG: NADH-quinone oxidoreductase subunit L [Chloroflexi bacterium]|nr:NADH-quinone oxidoreductase subunit L [Chloroflexota bacterium]